jgi:uncharacterized protein
MIYENYPLIAGVVAAILAQLLKPFFKFLRTRKVDLSEALSAGGFPSSHTASAAALALSLALQDGFDSATFAIAAILLFIVTYDAYNVRYYAGKNLQLTKQLIEDLESNKGVNFKKPIYNTKMKFVLGHHRYEAYAGIAFGFIISIIIYNIM